jgi:hypothetical protein
MVKELIYFIMELTNRSNKFDFSSRGSALPREEKSSVHLIAENYKR